MPVGGELGEHTEMSYVPSWHEIRTAESPRKSFPPPFSLYCIHTELIHLSQARRVFVSSK